MTGPAAAAAETRDSPAQISHIVVMGVSGCGKSTIGALLAQRLGSPFAEGDDFHSVGNRAKMASGIALTDADRWPWLAALRDWMSDYADSGRSTVVSCSALRRVYRDRLREAHGQVQFAHLRVTARVLEDRMAQRVGHYMPPSLLDSQLATLEALAPDEPGLVLKVEATWEPDAVASALLARLSPRVLGGPSSSLTS